MNTEAATIKEVMTQYDQKRAEWIAARGDDRGFDRWFTIQATAQTLRNSKTAVTYQPAADNKIDIFSGDDLQDSYNLSTFYNKTSRNHRKAWQALQAAFDDTFTMYDVIRVLFANGIRCHSYCRMD